MSHKNLYCKTCNKPCYAKQQWDSNRWDFVYCSQGCLKQSQDINVEEICKKFNITKDQLIDLLDTVDENFLEYEYWKEDNDAQKV